jgi:DNA topoisomerase II
MSQKTSKIKSSTSSEKVIKLSHREHVLKRPDSYIGSIDLTESQQWIFNIEENKMNKKTLKYIPGEYKLFDELIVNALDQQVRLYERSLTENSTHIVKNIKINVNQANGEISIFNDGEGIDTSMHNKEKKHIPELIFGDLLTSTNYNEDEIKHVGGKNGYGAKLVNIYSKKFTIETIDHINKKKYIQSFYDNMTRKDKPKITSNKTKPYTQITYNPDFEKFKTTGINDDMFKIMERRAYDMAAITGSLVNVYFNDKKIECKTFEKYIDLYIGNKKDTPRVYERVNPRWEIAATLNPELIYEQISFANGIYTSKGGKHVDYIANQLANKLSKYIQKKKKITVKANYIKENLIVFVKATIDNPSFSSQTKEELTTNKDKFGSKCEISDKFIDQLAKCGVMEKALELAAAKDNKDAEKCKGKKQNRLKGIPKLDDANWAGTKKSKECCLILTEGDSAKATALAGLAKIGRDKYGAFPLKGKLLNVRDIKNIKKIIENDEISNLIKIMGLQMNKKYKDLDSLRYGSILLFTDQDEDGSHIKGLLFNLFSTLWPTLFKFPNFLKGMLTPVVKAKKGKKEKSFYSVKDYEKWKKNSGTGWTSKYYKGLGTSTPAEAKQYFDPPKIINYSSTGDGDDNAINLAFSKSDNSADLRKEWLGDYDKDATLDYTNLNVTIKEFVHQDLKHFSNSDNARSIPSVVDGFKTSQRKVIFTAFKRNLIHSIRVAQLAGSASEISAYHHGEASLTGTIVGLAQDFIGSNNINLLDPIGQFGSRVLGGKDAAQPRYIHTKLMDISKKIFNQNDFKLLDYNNDDGLLVEPVYYVPIIPMILVNGCQGIGTGWSTDIPCFNPKDIISNIKNILDEKEYTEMKPWFRKFKGTIDKRDNHLFRSKGKYSFRDDDTMIISELPIGSWTDKYKEYLETLIIDSKVTDKKLLKKQVIKYYNSHSTDDEVKFEIKFPKDEGYLFELDPVKLEKIFKIASSINLRNMVLHNEHGILTKYDSVEEILMDFIDIRIKYYEKRRDLLMKEIQKDIDLLEIKIRFIMEFIEGKILINNKKKSEIIEQLENRKYPKLDDNYDFLLKMPIYNLTKEKIDEFNSMLENKITEYAQLEQSTSKSLWLNDLNELEIFIKKHNVLCEEESPKKKIKIIKKKK